jgi:hypothetical protein
MCKVLNKPLLLSAEFVAALDPQQFESVGQHALRGIEGLQEIYALPACQPASYAKTFIHTKV